MKVKPNKEDPIDKGKIRVFVYGTLKRDHANHVLLENSNAIFLGYDSITGPYKMFDMGAFPAVMHLSGVPEATMRGEVWAMDPEGLATVDLLEGNPHFYARRKLWSDRLQKRVWAYFLNPNWEPEIDDEDQILTNIWQPSEAEGKFWKLPDAG